MSGSLRVAVTGATGYVGSGVVRRLAAADPARVVAVVRNPDRAARLPAGVVVRQANYDDPAALTHAFTGVSTLVWVASDGAGPALIRQHRNVVAAAVAARVAHVVFTSIVDVEADSPFMFAAVYRDAEGVLASSGVPATVLRCNLYADFLWDRWLCPATATGTLALPVGAGRIAPVTRDDVAEACAAAALANAAAPHPIELSGPESLSFAEVTAEASRHLGVPLSYAPTSATEYVLHCWATMEDPWPHAFSSLCASICQGRFARVAPGVADVTGHAPEGFAAFLERVSRGPVTKQAADDRS